MLRYICRLFKTILNKQKSFNQDKLSRKSFFMTSVLQSFFLHYLGAIERKLRTPVHNFNPTFGINL